MSLCQSRFAMDKCEELRSRLEEATERNRAEAILLSGGLDSSILAFIARPTVGFTAALRDSGADDLIFSGKVSRLLGMENKIAEFSVEQALDALPEVIRILRTFNLALPNDLSIYLALKLARENNVSSVMTGDGGDELFAGYSYMANLAPEALGRYIRRIGESWHFSASELGRALGVRVKQPFLDKEFVSFAVEISPELKVKAGVGKYILRKSFENLIPAEILWRTKEPIEIGSGTSNLHEFIEGMVSDEEFQTAREKTGISFLNKEHSFYYGIYSEVVGEIPEARSNEQRCPCCGARLCNSYCRTCGFSQPIGDYLSAYG